MKTKIASGVCIVALLLTIFSGTRHPVYASPLVYSSGEFFPTAPYVMGYPVHVPPHSSRHLQMSAQRACLQGGGWNWRQGQVPMCFKPGNGICPAGHPWTRQTTQRYTICLSMSRPFQSPPPPTMGFR